MGVTIRGITGILYGDIMGLGIQFYTFWGYGIPYIHEKRILFSSWGNVG